MAVFGGSISQRDEARRQAMQNMYNNQLMGSFAGVGQSFKWEEEKANSGENETLLLLEDTE